MEKEVKQVYGPYLRDDGRKHVIVIYTDNSGRTVSYPKYLIKQQLNRIIEEPETVHHKDEDFTNDNLSNLEILPRGKHVSHHVRKPHEEVFGRFICPVCKEPFERRLSEVRGNQENQGKAGPYCSRRCAGIMHH